ncbi:MAG: Thiamine pyrophosphate-requiring enzymes, partial [uncultured Solirubrobacteraceae bacterium]
VRAHRRARRDERHERHGLGLDEQLADARARRARAGDALGAGVAAGDRPRAVRAAADEVRGDGRLDRGDPGAGRRGAHCRGDAAQRADLRRPAARPRLHGGRGVVGVRRPAAPVGGTGRRGRRARRRAAARRRAPGDHCRHGAVLGEGRGAAARARVRAADPRVPQRARARLPARRSPELLLAGALDGVEGRRRRARHRRADGLPARLRRLVRRGDRDHRARAGL